MSEPWWVRSAGPHRRAVMVGGKLAKQPQLLPPSRDDVAKELRSHIKYFTPEWTNARDAGGALVRLFSEQIEPALSRLNRLPEKTFIEFLNIAGLQLLPATPAKALLEFTVAEGAPQSVLVSKGFQVGAQSAVGSGELVTFETESDLYAAPSKIEEAYSQQGGLFLEVDVNGKDETASFLPFGKRGGPGRALLLGLSGDAAPRPMLSLGIGVASPPGAPPPIPSGGIAPLSVPPAPLLSWEILDGASFKQAEIVRDETGGLVRSGVIELALPRQWRIGPRPEGLIGDKSLRWLRLRILFGQYTEGPTLSFIKLNMVSAIAARTIRDEVLQPVANSKGRVMLLSQTPILPKSLVLEIDEGELSEAGQARTRVWEEVESLSDRAPDERVYVLDNQSGEVTFGDGLHGALVPPGFRNVRAIRYRVGGGEAGAAEAKAVNTLISSVPFIKTVENPLPASGGADTESQVSAMRRGPQEIRARGRAVTTADYELMALRTEGAQVKRAHAVSGLHASFPGRPIPGVVGIFIVPPDRNEGPPTPDEQTLRAVADGLSKTLAPAGVQVIAAAPRYHRVRAEVGIAVSPLEDEGSVVREVLKTLNTYLHPLTGGDDGNGWPFGGVIRNPSVLRRLLAIAGVSAVPRLNIVLDGNRNRGCIDVPISQHSLLWPEGHEVIVIEPGGEA